MTSTSIFIRKVPSLCCYRYQVKKSSRSLELCLSSSFHSSASSQNFQPLHNKSLLYSNNTSSPLLSHCQTNCFSSAHFSTFLPFQHKYNNRQIIQDASNYEIFNKNNNHGHLLLQVLSHDISLPSQQQARYLHKNASRRRNYNRTFSSNEKTNNPPNKESEVDDSKQLEEDDDKKLTLYQRFKKTYREHGKVLVVVHLMTSAVWFGTFFTAARLGVDIVPLLEGWNLSEKIISPFRSGGLGDAALAYLMYKLATPARYTVTIGGTNLAIRYLKKEGRIHPVAKEDTLREMYKEGKEDLKTRGNTTRRRIGNMRQRLQGRIRRVRSRRHQRDH